MMPTVIELTCVGCQGRLQEEAQNTLRCVQCEALYPIVDGIPSCVEKGEWTRPRGPALDLSVVIPALNEAASLERLLPKLRTAIEAHHVSYEVLVVSGASTDATREVALANGADVRSQQLAGFGWALRTGFAQARGEYILTLDADGSHDPGVFERLWAARSGAELVIASRYVAGGSADMSPIRYLSSRVLNAVFGRGLSLPVADISSGYRLYASSVLRNMALNATNFDILAEILIRALAAGHRITEIPLQYQARLAGKSHARLGKFGLSYARTFARMWRLRNSIASADYDDRAFDSVIPLQRYWQRRRYQVISRRAEGFPKVLDVGCGSSRILASHPNLVGLDVQLQKLRHARRFGSALVHGSIFNLPFADASFDCVICSEVVEHVPADEKAFHELARVLKPGGRLILGTPDYARATWRFLEWLYKRLSPGGYADEHITHYEQATLTAYLRSLGFTVEGIDYVCRSEMIVTARKAASVASSPVVVAPRSRPAERVVNRVLVTGGAGFIGQATSRALAARGYHVRIFDKLTAPVHPAGEWPAALDREFECIKGDIAERGDLVRALRGIDAVIHLAAYQDYLPDFSTFVRTNSAGTALLYELIVREEMPVKRIVVASSQAVYGEGAYRCEQHGLRYPNARSLSQLRAQAWELTCDRCGGPMRAMTTDERSSNPQNSYGISKLGQELLGIHLGRRYGIPTVALRYSITQGAGQSPNNAYSGVCRIFAACALQAKPFPIYEDGQQLRDYVHVDDVVAANLLSLEDGRTDYEAFNVGGSTPMSVLAYANLVREVAGSDVPLEINHRFRVGDTRHIVSDSAKLMRLGWRQTKPVRQIVEEYLGWVSRQPLAEDVTGAALTRMQELGVVGAAP